MKSAIHATDLAKAIHIVIKKVKMVKFIMLDQKSLPQSRK